MVAILSMSLNIDKLFGVFSTYHYSSWILPLLLINCLNSCINPLLFIGVLWRESFDILKVHYLMTSFFPRILLFNYIPFLMLIGLVIKMIALLLELIPYFLLPILFLGVPRNRVMLLSHRLKLNIDELPQLLLNYVGFNLSYLSLVLHALELLLFIVIMLVLLTYVLIMFFTLRLSTLRLIFFLFEI